MLWRLMLLRRVVRALGHAARQEDFLPVLGSGALLVSAGTATYALGEGWNLIDAFYFAVVTLTTASIADPHLVLDKRWMKLFTVVYLLIGIGILVEILRQLATSFVTVGREPRA
jgi:hypothetical protein